METAITVDQISLKNVISFLCFGNVIGALTGYTVLGMCGFDLCTRKEEIMVNLSNLQGTVPANVIVGTSDVFLQLKNVTSGDYKEIGLSWINPQTLTKKSISKVTVVIDNLSDIEIQAFRNDFAVKYAGYNYSITVN